MKGIVSQTLSLSFALSFFSLRLHPHPSLVIASPIFPSILTSPDVHIVLGSIKFKLLKHVKAILHQVSSR